MYKFDVFAKLSSFNDTQSLFLEILTATMSGINQDCSIAAAVFAFVLTLINAVLFFISVYTLYKFCRDYYRGNKNGNSKKHNKKTRKILFVSGSIFFVFSSFGLLATLTNIMSICFHGSDTNYLDFHHWIYFIIFYGIQTYFLWLILFLRLKYVFEGSIYKLSKLTVRIHIVIFIFIPIIAPCLLLILSYIKSNLIYTILLLLLFIFIIIFSMSLSILFIYKLYNVFKINQQHKNSKLLQTISKSTILAIISLSLTFLTPITMLMCFYSIHHSQSTNNQRSISMEIATSILAVICLFDVFTNYFCILLSYNCFDKLYGKLCGKFDTKCRQFCIVKIFKHKVKSHKKITKSGHIEVSSNTSMTGMTLTPSTHTITTNSGATITITPKNINSNYTSLRSKSISSSSLSYKPNGDLYPGHQQANVKTIYEHCNVDTDYDDDDEFEDDQDDDDGTINGDLPTPFTQDIENTNFNFRPNEEENQQENEQDVETKGEGEGLLHTF